MTDITPLPAPFSKSQLGVDITISELSRSLSNLDNWMQRYRQLFKLADLIIPLEDIWKVDKYLIEGCENPVWLIHHYDSIQMKHYFMADSDSKIIKGLLALLLAACNGHKGDEIVTFDLKLLLEKLDFGKYLTPSRTNGLLSVMNKIFNYCNNSTLD